MTPGWTDLLALPSGEREFLIPGSAPAVRLRPLHRDRATGATLALVDFPSGWERPGVGHYLAGEEFAVLRGALWVGSDQFAAGEWGWVPPGAHREPCTTPSGARALAWFSGPSDWIDAPGTDGLMRRSPLVTSPGRARQAGVPGGSALTTGPIAPADVVRDVLRVHDLGWVLLPPGEQVRDPGGPCLVRSWR